MNEFNMNMINTNYVKSNHLNTNDYEREINTTQNLIIKCCVLGDTYTGKTTLFNQLLQKDINYISPTMGVDFGALNVTEKYEDKNVKIQIWDTAGQEKFRSISKNYIRDIFIILLVFDISNTTSFKNLEYWLNEIKHTCTENVHMILIANKNDKKHRVSNNDIFEFTQKYNNIKCWFKISSKQTDDAQAIIKQILFYANNFIQQTTPIKENFIYETLDKYTDGLYIRTINDIKESDLVEVKTGGRKYCNCVIS